MHNYVYAKMSASAQQYMHVDNIHFSIDETNKISHCHKGGKKNVHIVLIYFLTDN